jgi:hypothetical protein
MASIRSCIEQQLNEIELLRCCYSSSDEFNLDDIEAFNEAKEFLNGKFDNIQKNLSFILKLHLNDIKVKIFKCEKQKKLFYFFRQLLNFNLFIHFIIPNYQLIFVYVLISHVNVMKNLMNQ